MQFFKNIFPWGKLAFKGYELMQNAILKARYNKNNVPRYFIISWIIGNNLKILIKPIVKKRTKEVNPKVTPRIWGIVLTIPKLNPEYEATTLFGPGV